ncbi:putative spermidine/putrescine transport system substrate-binding protein [Nakamurella panacisegetis]|uniref:Putative spermidine/putrescine transport system substrate-binding protein n=1 Tax=Nakamurella panacisegetis TaxID=1090615 RepID=A0A1H0JK30_9ACTN|nr:ABC transporter substrate-binding protein [Nakamurella panacisegetis]SDO44138.1 putative spermidine/putrescine transport system substrate-binding protein [Nakamurella panacisegetis]
MRVVTSRSALSKSGAIAGLAVLALVVSACGSKSSSSPATSASPAASSASAPAASGSSAAASSAPAGSSSAPAASGSSSAPAGGSTSDASKATSAAALGGMDALVAAANKEGALNVIALPPDWADYADIIAGFQKKYPGIKLTSLLPDASSAQEISAAQTAKGTDQAPDVFDVGSAVALASTQYFAPYQVAAWKDIPAANKESTGLWVNDYTGVMSVGYNADLTGELTSLADLTNPKLKGLVALNGDPTQANSPLQAVMMASLANGGSLSDISKGVDYFKSLKAAGTLSSTKSSSQAVAAGSIGVVFDWSYNQLAITQAGAKAGLTWKTFTPKGVTLTSYYNQAINKDAPHPAAARLWEEYLYSAEAQNFWMKGGALPILYNAMKTAGTLDAAAAKNLPAITGDIQSMTPEQNTAANKYLAANWAKAVG